MPPTNPPPYPVLVHTYLSSTSPPRSVQAYEHLPSTPSPTTTTAKPKNALIFLGGLGDGPHTLTYPRTLATHLPPSLGYTVFEARLSSAFSAFGYSSLAQDAREVADLVRYLRTELGRERVVVMGHSTGCQDCLEYGTKYERKEGEGVDGFVLQGPVSDREAVGLVEERDEVERSLRVAEGMVKEGRVEEVVERGVMPMGWRGAPVTAGRWCSLVGVGGDDDYFSSDLGDDKLESIWGRLQQPVLILPSEKDEWVPSSVDVIDLVNRWKSFCKPGIASELSALIPGANHQVADPEAQKWLAERVAAFLAEIDKGRE